MSVARVFVDATVLFSRTHRDWLLHARVVTAGDVFSIQTSEDVLVEALARLRDNNPRWDGGALTRVRTAVHEVFDEVLTDFPGDVAWPGTDDGDLHVHAAAVHAGSTMLLTSDSGLLALRGLADGVPYEPIHPDEFFCLLDDSNERQVQEMTRRQLAHYAARNQPAELADRLRRAQCPHFADRVEERIAQLAGPRAHRRFLQQKRSASTQA